MLAIAAIWAFILFLWLIVITLKVVSFTLSAWSSLRGIDKDEASYESTSNTETSRSQSRARERSGAYTDAEVARMLAQRDRRRRRSSMPEIDDDECDALAARAEALRY